VSSIFEAYFCRVLKGLYSLVILICLAYLGNAQYSGNIFRPERAYSDTVWIVTGKKELGPLFQKQKLDFVLDARQTLISNTQARIAGLRIGVEYRRVHRFGFGFYGLGDGVRMSSLTELDSSITDATLNLAYASLYYERVLFFNRKWEWSATGHIGRGQITGVYRKGEQAPYEDFPTRSVRPVEVSTTGYYHLTWWCSIGFGVGYRYMRSTPQEVRPIFNAPVAIARVRIKLGKLVKSVWDENAKYEY